MAYGVKNQHFLLVRSCAPCHFSSTTSLALLPLISCLFYVICSPIHPIMFIYYFFKPSCNLVTSLLKNLCYFPTAYEAKSRLFWPDFQVQVSQSGFTVTFLPFYLPLLKMFPEADTVHSANPFILNPLACTRLRAYCQPWALLPEGFLWFLESTLLLAPSIRKLTTHWSFLSPSAALQQGSWDINSQLLYFAVGWLFRACSLLASIVLCDFSLSCLRRP